ncbi:hypothetical protein CKK34_3694 [Yarrowia sp. E02]|nr:hypothetical protein CKK34_3694 [Yarrowia sp. E02]
MRFSTTLLSLISLTLVNALPVANDERDVVVTQEHTVTTTWCPETVEGVPATPIEKVVTATVVTTVQSTDVVTAPCSKCEEEAKAHETPVGVPEDRAVPHATPAVPEKPAEAPAPAPAPVVTSPPQEEPLSTVWNVVTQYTTICPENYVPPPCDEQAAALSSVASAVANGTEAAAGIPASVSIPDSLTAALASAINAAATYSVDPNDDDVTYVDVTVTPTSTINYTVTPTVTVGGSPTASSIESGKTAGVSTDAASKKIIGNAAPTPGPTVSTASDFSASVASAASAAVDQALKELAF